LERLIGLYEDEKRAELNLLGKQKAEEDAEKLNIPSHMECLRPGITFEGFQQSKDNKYHVNVEVKDVSLAEYVFTGYLTIENLTANYPSLTTFFEAEIIGNKYGFLTRKWVIFQDAVIYISNPFLGY
jgi:hypothetical protein